MSSKLDVSNRFSSRKRGNKTRTELTEEQRQEIREISCKCLACALYAKGTLDPLNLTSKRGRGATTGTEEQEKKEEEKEEEDDEMVRAD